MKGLQVLNPWHFRRKSRQSLWPRTGHLPEKLPFSPFLSALRCFLIDVMLRTTLVSWEWLQWRPHSSCICSYRTHRQKNPETPTFWKRFRNNELLHGAHFWRFFSHRKNCEVFLSCLHVLSPHTDSPRLCYSVEEGGYTALPVSSHVEQPPMPPQTEKDCRLEATLTHVPHSPCA